MSPETVRRWIKQGVNGVRLEHRRVGAQLMTWRSALNRFIEECTASEDVVTYARVNPSDERELAERHGI